MTLVVILTVLAAKAEAFRAFEREAARVMARHGGAIERVVVIPGAPDAGTFQEVHIVTFPDRAAYEAYRADPALAPSRHLREASVVDALVLEGEEGPAYGPE